jgi:uncharacterized membrane protein
MSKTGRLAFIASLVLNLLFLGIILGQVPRASAPPSSRDQRREQALKKFPEPLQTRLREKFAEVRASGDPYRQQMDEARDETLRMLSTEPFDAAAYDAQLRKMEALRIEIVKSMGQRIRQQAKELTPEERRALAEVLRRPARPPAE